MIPKNAHQLIDLSSEYVPISPSEESYSAIDIINNLRDYKSIFRCGNIIINTISEEIYQITEHGVKVVDRVNCAELPSGFGRNQVKDNFDSYHMLAEKFHRFRHNILPTVNENVVPQNIIVHKMTAEDVEKTIAEFASFGKF